MNKKFSFFMKQNAIAMTVASGLSLVPVLADAAGLGRITVYSALGQPLRAEIQIAAAGDELLGMTARLAPEEAFRQANVDRFSQSLTGLRFSVEKRQDGVPVVKVTSGNPIHEPFMDFLVELNWPSGRLVREYTFLLDPPEIMAQAVRSQPVVGAVVSPAAKVTAVKRGDAADPKGQADTAAPRVAAAGEHVVKKGETLRGIAAENQYAGVSLEQMLVALYRNNTEAFIGKNMNRLRSGVVLQIPSESDVAAVSVGEARKVFHAQSSEWNSYRNRLAGTTGTSSSESGGRSTSGRVNARVEEPPQDDQVKISSSAKTTGKGGASEEDMIAKDRALKEYKERVALLEKDIKDLQKALELQSKQMSDLQKQAQASIEAQQQAADNQAKSSSTNAEKKTEKSEPVTPNTPEDIPPPVQENVTPPETTPSVPEEVVPPVDMTEEPSASESEGSDSNQPDDASAGSEPAQPPVVQPKPAPLPPPVVEEDSGLLLPVAAGVAALLAAVGGFVFLKRRRKPSRGDSLATTTQGLTEVVKQPRKNEKAGKDADPSSVVQTPGGQSVNTRQDAPAGGHGPQTLGSLSSLSLSAPGVIDSSDMDPVSEADLYMGYHKYDEAEEILIDALQKDPERLAISVKLLEVYALRKSRKQFEALATDVHARTNGQGEEWDKVVALGREIDPDNALYGGKGTADVDANAAAAFATYPESASVGTSLNTAASENAFDFDVKTDPSLSVSQMLPSQGAGDVPEDSFTFDLGENDPSFEVTDFGSAPVAQPPADAGTATDFDLSFVAPSTSEPAISTDIFGSDTVVVEMPISVLPASEVSEPAPPQREDDVKPSNFEMSEIRGLSGKAPSMSEPISSLSESGVEFDVALTESTVLGKEALQSNFFSGIDLNLKNEPSQLKVTPAPAPAPDAPMTESFIAEMDLAPDSSQDEVNTKLELAQAYEDMGDLEGARELLKEVIGEGSSAQVAQAQSILDRLGG